MFEREAIPQVNKSSLNTFPIIAIKTPWIIRITKPAKIYAGAWVSSIKFAFDAIKPISIYNSTFETSGDPGILASGVIAKITPKIVVMIIVQPVAPINASAGTFTNSFPIIPVTAVTPSETLNKKNISWKVISLLIVENFAVKCSFILSIFDVSAFVHLLNLFANGTKNNKNIIHIE